MSSLSQRPLAVGDIEYIYIPKERSGLSVIFPPDDFDNNIITLLGSLPKNLVQLNDPFTHFGNVKMVQTLTPHRFGVCYPDNISFLVKTNPYKISCKVFFLHSETENLDAILKTITSAFSLVFLIKTDAPLETFPGFEEYTITSPLDFIQKLIINKETVENILLHSFPRQQIPFEVTLDIGELHHAYNPRHVLKACDANCLTLNQTLGNAWVETEIPNDAREPDLNEMEALVADPKSASRFKMILSQVEKMDQLEIMVLEDRNIRFPNQKDEWLSPLVLILPFNYPTLTDIIDPEIGREELKRFRKVLSYEQSLNYILYTSIEGTDVRDANTQAHLLSSKTSYLDFMGYLHASFTSSPVVRFPQLANSIKTSLSFFKPDTINHKKRKNAKKLIDDFGRKLSTLIIPEGLDTELFLIPRQIVAITDLPIEWLMFKGQNLCFNYDVTRVPETPYGGILASFAANSHAQFVIKEDILSRTLILLGVSTEENKDREFKLCFDAVVEQAKQLNCRAVRCSSIKDVAEQIRLHEPDLLIFDCHGGFDPATASSYLKINGERLTGADIVRHKISAPLVFLSACHTNPNYGYLNKIANAFFEAGCLAITATYFPISVYNGTNIYARLLNNLSYASKHAVHKNWLNFVSHVIRTSYFKDIIQATQQNVRNSSLDEIEKNRITGYMEKLNMEIGVHFLRFDLRPKVMDLLYKKLSENIPKSFIDRTTVPEYIFYTNMGRGDLVRFKCWQKKFDELNKFNQGAHGSQKSA